MSYRSSCPDDSIFYTCPNLTACFVTPCKPPCGEGSGRCPEKHEQQPNLISGNHDEILIPTCRPNSSLYMVPYPHAYPYPPYNPFVGCCQTYSCSKGCQQGSLSLSAFSDNKTIMERFWSAIGASCPSTKSSSLSSSSSSYPSSSPVNIDLGTGTLVPSSAPTATIVGQPTPVTSKSASKSTNTPILTSTDTSTSVSTDTTTSKSNSTAIAGGVAGGIVGLALLVGLLAILRRRRNARPQHTVEGRSSALGSGQSRSLQADSAELEEMKQGPTLSRWSFLYEHAYG